MRRRHNFYGPHPGVIIAWLVIGGIYLSAITWIVARSVLKTAECLLY